MEIKRKKRQMSNLRVKIYQQFISDYQALTEMTMEVLTKIGERNVYLDEKGSSNWRDLLTDLKTANKIQ